MADKDDLITQFLKNEGTGTMDKHALDWALHGEPVGTSLRQLVLKLAKWCYYEGYNDADEAHR